jgi:hypothetical protein
MNERTDTQAQRRRSPHWPRLLAWAAVLSVCVLPVLAQDPIWTNLESQVVQTLDLDDDGRIDYTVLYDSVRYEYVGSPFYLWKDTVTFRLLPAAGNLVVGRADGVGLGFAKGAALSEQAPAGFRWLGDTNGALVAGVLYYRDVWPGSWSYPAQLDSYPPVDPATSVGYVAVRFRAKDGERFGWVRAAMAIQPDPPLWDQGPLYYPLIKLACGPWQHVRVGSGVMKAGEPQPVPKLLASRAYAGYVRISWTPQEHGCVFEHRFELGKGKWTNLFVLPVTPSYYLLDHAVQTEDIFGWTPYYPSAFWRLRAP